jgi:phosphoserine phosphatase
LISDARDYFEYIFVNELQFDEVGQLKGIKATDYDFSGKVAAVELICKEKGIRLSDVVFVGGSSNDADVVRKVGLSIGYPPSCQELTHICNHCIEENDLSLILPCVIGNSSEDETDGSNSVARAGAGGM